MKCDHPTSSNSSFVKHYTFAMLQLLGILVSITAVDNYDCATTCDKTSSVDSLKKTVLL